MSALTIRPGNIRAFSTNSTKRRIFILIASVRSKWIAAFRGRVALVGDAAFCVSLLAGQGSALAMTAAYVLAGELAKAKGDHHQAFREYQKILQTFISSKQRGAEQFATAFAPRTRWGLFFRNQVIKMLTIPGLARLTFGRDITDSLALPEYRWPAFASRQSERAN